MNAKVLYSRTQAAVGHISGGALAHTLGVIHGFAQLGDIFVLTNEAIHGMDQLTPAIPFEIVKPIGSGGVSELFYNLYYPARLSARMARFRPDFVYHRFGGLSYATARVCRSLKIPLVLEFNSSPVWGLRQRERSIKQRLLAIPKSLILSRIESYNLHNAFLIVVPGEPLKDRLVGLGFPEERILFNPNAVNPGKFKPLPKEQRMAIRKRLGIDADKTVVGFAGTFSSWHGIPELTAAIIKLNGDPSRQRQLFFVLYGDGALRPKMEAELARLSNVLFTGRIEYEQVQDYLSICDILVSPHGQPSPESIAAGWPGASPTKVFEYMAMGKGIVASDLDYIGKLIRNGETGVSVPPGDIDALVAGITFLADHPQEAQRLGQNARQFVCREHTWEQHVRRIIERVATLQNAGTDREPRRATS